MRVREPVVAGRFYPDDPQRCREQLRELLASPPEQADPIGRPIGGIVPHAGWTFSGQVAASVLGVLASRPSPSVLVLFGGVHRSRSRHAAMFADGRWDTPIGSALIESRLAERILGQSNLIIDDPFAHEDEHSLEVQVPFLISLFPGVPILPIMVPPVPDAHEVGEAVARTLKAYRYDAIIIGTTDLTHYGPGYGFAPHGVGNDAMRWARDKNDRRFIDLICRLEAEKLVDEAVSHRNACSSGASAATVAAVVALGAARATLLGHTTSAEVMARQGSATVQDSVGYAGIVFD